MGTSIVFRLQDAPQPACQVSQGCQGLLCTEHARACWPIWVTSLAIFLQASSISLLAREEDPGCRPAARTRGSAPPSGSPLPGNLAPAPAAGHGEEPNELCCRCSWSGLHAAQCPLQQSDHDMDLVQAWEQRENSQGLLRCRHPFSLPYLKNMTTFLTSSLIDRQCCPEVHTTATQRGPGCAEEEVDLGVEDLDGVQAPGDFHEGRVQEVAPGTSPPPAWRSSPPASGPAAASAPGDSPARAHTQF